MQLPGRLHSTSLGDVLGALYRGRANGTLELTSRDGTVHRIALSSGLVERIDSPMGAPPLGYMLRELGLLSASRASVLDRLVDSTPGKCAGQLLVEKQLAAAPVVAVALRRQAAARLEALFLLRDARLTFRPRRLAQPVSPRPVPLLPSDFLHGRPRSRSRSQARSVPEPSEPLSVLGLPSGADRAAIRSAFRRLAAVAHPDRHPGASEAERHRLAARFAELSVAYHALLGAA